MALLVGFFINLRVRIKTPSCNISSTIRQPSNASTTASIWEHAPQLPGISEHFPFFCGCGMSCLCVLKLLGRNLILLITIGMLDLTEHVHNTGKELDALIEAKIQTLCGVAQG